MDLKSYRNPSKVTLANSPADSIPAEQKYLNIDDSLWHKGWHCEIIEKDFKIEDINTH